jgi:hypothetical protein
VEIYKVLPLYQGAYHCMILKKWNRSASGQT